MGNQSEVPTLYSSPRGSYGVGANAGSLKEKCPGGPQGTLPSSVARPLGAVGYNLDFTRF
jgi:hypothetical protein